MKYLEYKTTPKIIQKKDFNIVNFNFIFPVECDYKKGVYLKILDYIICTTNKQFHDLSSFKKEMQKKSILSLKLSTFTKGKNAFINFHFSIPKENLYDDYDFESSFKFAVDCLYNPYVENNEFNIDKFLYERDYFLDMETHAVDTIYGKNIDELFKIIDPNEYFGLSHDNCMKALMTANSKELYKLYNQHIVYNNFLTIINGNINVDKANYLINKYLPKQPENIKIENKFFNFFDMLKYEEIERITDFHQTEVDFVYQVKNLKISEIDYFDIIYYFIQCSENDLLMRKLRRDNSLVYEAKMIRFNSAGLYIIKSFTKYENKNKIILCVKEIFNELIDENKIKIYLEKLIEAMEVESLIEHDDPYSDLNLQLNKIYGTTSLKEKIKIYKNISIDNLINFIKRIKLTKLVIFKGEE